MVDISRKKNMYMFRSTRKNPLYLLFSKNNVVKLMFSEL